MPRKSPRRARLSLETLEVRENPATSLIALGADAGGGPRVTWVDPNTGGVVRDFFAFDPSFTGGVRVAVADFNADGSGDVVATPGPGGGPLLRVLDGKTGGEIKGLTAFEEAFRGGLNVAVGDVTGDRAPDIVVAADAGGGPRVQIIDGKTFGVVNDFFAFDSTFRGGARVTLGDTTGDGKAEVIAAAGPGGGPAVRVIDAATAKPIAAFFSFEPTFRGGSYVASADLDGDRKAEIVVGAGKGGGPVVRVLDGQTGALESAFLAFDPFYTGGVRVGTYAATAFGAPLILAAPGAGIQATVKAFGAEGKLARDYGPLLPGFTGGVFVGGDNFAARAASALVEPTPDPAPTPGPVLVTLQLKPLDIDLLGLRVTTGPITVTISADQGEGKLLGNLLTVVGNLVNLQGTNAALNNVLDSVVTLLNDADLLVEGVTQSGSLGTAPAEVTPILDLFVAPVRIDLLGVNVDTSPIELKIFAESGEGKVLGNVLRSLTNLFNPPLPDRLNLADINVRLSNLLAELDAQLPGFNIPVEVTPVPPAGDAREVLRLSVPPIDVNLLGLLLKTDRIQVNADAQLGNGELLGNIVNLLLDTAEATPGDIQALNDNVNGLLAKVIGVLNASSLLLSEGALGGLSDILQTLASPFLVLPEGTAGITPVLDLAIVSPDGTTPPVDVDLLGLKITTSDVRAQLLARTGEGQVLGNLVYNVAHLLDPGGELNLLTILGRLGL